MKASRAADPPLTRLRSVSFMLLLGAAAPASSIARPLVAEVARPSVEDFRSSFVMRNALSACIHVTKQLARDRNPGVTTFVQQTRCALLILWDACSVGKKRGKTHAGTGDVKLAGTFPPFGRCG
jgi:hypothetical protein